MRQQNIHARAVDLAEVRVRGNKTLLRKPKSTLGGIAPSHAAWGLLPKSFSAHCVHFEVEPQGGPVPGTGAMDLKETKPIFMRKPANMKLIFPPLIFRSQWTVRLLDRNNRNLS